MAHRPTRRQKALLTELRQLVHLFHLDFESFHRYPGRWHATHLEIARDKLIRGQIVVWYTFVDELLNVALCRYFFGRRANFIRLWKTKRFKTFNFFILESLTVLEKLAFVRAIHDVPKSVVRDVEQLNAVRNGLAHAFFPQNLRRNRPTYKGKDVFSVDGVTRLQADVDAITSYFEKIAPWAA